MDSGLGLPAAQELISRHGGLIEFESRPGRTVFFVSHNMQIITALCSRVILLENGRIVFWPGRSVIPATSTV